MGGYSSLIIGPHEVFSAEREIDPLVMSVFRVSDKIVRKITSDEAADEGYSDFVEEKEDDFTVVEYASSVAILRDRLDVLGYGMPYCRRAFDEGRSERIEKLARQVEEKPANADELRKQSEVLARLTLDNWSQTFAQAWNEGSLVTGSYSNGDLLADFPLGYMFGLGEWLGFNGLPTHDVLVFLRAVLEIPPGDMKVAYNLTGLLYTGWASDEEEICEIAEEYAEGSFLRVGRTIIMTEGRSDKRALEGALRVLAPHLFDYFTFLDFEQMKVAGGAPSLVGFVKAFAAAGISNRVAALFDNDTAARSALRSIERLRLPENIRVVSWPEIQLGRRYPTLGPSGVVEMDVNGLAGSIELYFGEDVLRREDGSLTPVQWRGYDRKLDQYQGELLDKPLLQERFVAKVRSCLAQSKEGRSGDWSGMELLVRLLQHVFDDAGPD